MTDSGGGSAAPETGRAEVPKGSGSGAAEKGRSWADVAKGEPRRQYGSSYRSSPRVLELLQKRFSEVVDVPEEELEGNRSEWRNSTIIVRSLGRYVPADWVAREIKRVGRLGYDVECFLLMDGFFAVRFANEADREAAMARGLWMVAGQLLAMDRWRPNFIPGDEGLSRVVVWLRMPRLPLDYWKKPTIMRIAATTGTPLALDEVTEQGRRYGFARVKIALNCSAPLKPGTLVRGSSKGVADVFWQDFIYENLPAPCSRCGRIGHATADCTFSMPEAEVAEEGEIQGDGMESPRTSAQENRGSGEPEDLPMFGLWMVTGHSRAPRVAKVPARRKTRAKPGVGPRSAPTSPRSDLKPGVNRADAESSPIDLEGW
ncbi:uncharacterized protein LOC120108502 [Phoenix dactylifera]|uniref:Uncharacterized protein LOC120108502 n=1 Tax=Phoenix dactylifera TaxID=42345 RepID=A0A8B8ZUS2_PHODC|nr:uncharacterized protein LOC120108502 [Phoenix dactylifera]